MFKGFCHLPFFFVKDYPSDRTIHVRKITRTVLGKEVTKQCGNEGRHKYLNTTGKTTLRFLQAAISHVTNAIEAGADLTNAAFIFAQPGREFVIKAGDGDWEFYFSEDANDEIQGCCVRKPYLSTFWDGCKESIAWLGSTFFGDSGGATGLPALTQA